MKLVYFLLSCPLHCRELNKKETFRSYVCKAKKITDIFLFFTNLLEIYEIEIESKVRTSRRMRNFILTVFDNSQRYKI